METSTQKAAPAAPANRNFSIVLGADDGYQKVLSDQESLAYLHGYRNAGLKAEEDFTARLQIAASAAPTKPQQLISAPVGLGGIAIVLLAFGIKGYLDARKDDK